MMNPISAEELSTFEHHPHVYRLQLIRDEGGLTVELLRDGQRIASARVSEWLDAVRWGEQQARLIVRGV